MARMRIAPVLLGFLVLVAACGSAPAVRMPVPTPSPTVPAGTDVVHRTTAPARAEPHIMVLMMENESYRQVIGAKPMPYLSSLAHRYLLATDSHARMHYSLPNYLELISGYSYAASGTNGDCSPSSCGPVAGAEIGDQLNRAGIGWRAFLGGMTSDCQTSNAGGSGGYGVRHNPFVYFPQGRSAPSCSHDVPATGLIPALNSAAPPSFVFYAPSICHDGGYDASCSTLASADHFLSRRIPQIMATAWYRDHGTIILTWDEGAGSDTSGSHGDVGGHVATLVISASTRGHAPYRKYVDTAGILRTIEHAYRLRYLGNAARASSGTLPLG